MKRWVSSLILVLGLWLAIGVYSEETADTVPDEVEAGGDDEESEITIRRSGGRKRVVRSSGKIEFPGDQELQSIFERVLNPFVSRERPSDEEAEVVAEVKETPPERNLIDELSALLEFAVHALPDPDEEGNAEVAAAESAPAAAENEVDVETEEVVIVPQEPSQVVVIDLGEAETVENRSPGFGLLAKLFESTSESNPEPEIESTVDADSDSEETVSIVIERIPDEPEDEPIGEPTAPSEMPTSSVVVEIDSDRANQTKPSLLSRVIGARANSTSEEGADGDDRREDSFVETPAYSSAADGDTQPREGLMSRFIGSRSTAAGDDSVESAEISEAAPGPRTSEAPPVAEARISSSLNVEARPREGLLGRFIGNGSSDARSASESVESPANSIGPATNDVPPVEATANAVTTTTNPAAAESTEIRFPRIVGRLRIGPRGEPAIVETNSDAPVELIDDDSEFEVEEIIVEIGPERDRSAVPLVVGNQAGESVSATGAGIQASADARPPAEVYIAGFGESKPIRQLINESDRGNNLREMRAENVVAARTLTPEPEPEPEAASPTLVAEMDGPAPSWPFRPRKREEKSPPPAEVAAAEPDEPESKEEATSSWLFGIRKREEKAQPVEVAAVKPLEAKPEPKPEPQKRARFRIRIANQNKDEQKPAVAENSDQRALVAELKVRNPESKPKPEPKQEKRNARTNEGGLFGSRSKSSGESKAKSRTPNEPLADGYVFASKQTRFFQLSNRSRKSDQRSPVDIRRGTVLKLRNPGDHYYQVQTASGLIGIAPADAFRTATKREAEVFDLAAAKMAAEESSRKPAPSAAPGPSLQDVSAEDLPLGLGLLTPTE
ncbi:MAG: hypothetical protein AAF585_14125 [Verrucomicrobiota bacterium]